MFVLWVNCIDGFFICMMVVWNIKNVFIKWEILLILGWNVLK